MKKMKKLLLIAFCCVLTLTTVNVPGEYEINPLGHYNDADSNRP